MADPIYISDGSQVGDMVLDPRRHFMPLMGCRITNNAEIVIPDTTLTALTFDTESFNQGGTIHSTTTNTGRITFNAPGIYAVVGMARFVASAAGTFRRAWIRLNGAATYLDTADAVPNVSVSGALHLSTFYRFAPGDYVELVVAQDSAGNLNVSNAQGSPHFEAMWWSR